MYPDETPDTGPENQLIETLKISYFGCTDTGLVRKDNEDVYLSEVTINGSLFVVCDGMGGHSRGKLAARTAAEQIWAMLKVQYFDEARAGLYTAISYANQEIANLNHNKIQHKRMGTTVVCALIRQGQFYFAHVGDSRLYMLRSGILTQLTQDHTYVQQLLAHGVITEDEARVHPERHHLLQAVGIEYDINPTVAEQSIECKPGDLFLLCTDGITETLDKDELQRLLLEEDDLQQKAENLIETAKELGSDDNLTALLIRID